MKKIMNKDLNPSLVCGIATLFGIINIFEVEGSIMKGFYGLLSIIFLIGTIRCVKKYSENKKINEIDDEENE